LFSFSVMSYLKSFEGAEKRKHEKSISLRFS
jgi:hypothetical protein